MTETIEAVAPTSVELEPVSDHTLFRKADPIDAIEEAKRVAAKFKTELEAGDMVKRIGSAEHVTVEGWTTLGSMLGVVGVITWTRRLEDPTGWEARAEARTLDGRVVGAGEALCSRQERNWARRDEYALRAMAQTRALSRALRAPLGFVVTLAGAEATPAEEVDAEAEVELSSTELPEWAKPASIKDTAQQLTTVLESIGVEEPGKSAREIGQEAFAYCGETIPACVLVVLEHLAATAALTGR